MRSFLVPILLACLTGSATGADPPDVARGRSSKGVLELGNRAIRYVLQTDADHAGPLTVTNLHTDQTLRLTEGFLPQVVLENDRKIDLIALRPTGPPRLETIQGDPAGLPVQTRHGGQRISATFRDGHVCLDAVAAAANVRSDIAGDMTHARVEDESAP